MPSKRKNITKSLKKIKKPNPSSEKEKGSKSINAKDREVLTLPQVAPLLLDEWKYHNEMFSQAVYRYGLAEVFITIAPYLISGLIKDLGNYVLIFPSLAFLVALYAAYHLLSLSMYIWQSDNNYRKVMGEYAPTMKFVTGNAPYKNLLIRFMKSLEEALLLQNVTQQLAFIFLPLSLMIQIINSIILVNLMNQP